MSSDNENKDIEKISELEKFKIAIKEKEKNQNTDNEESQTSYVFDDNEEKDSNYGEQNSEQDYNGHSDGDENNEELEIKKMKISELEKFKIEIREKDGTTKNVFLNVELNESKILCRGFLWDTIIDCGEDVQVLSAKKSDEEFVPNEIYKTAYHKTALLIVFGFSIALLISIGSIIYSNFFSSKDDKEGSDL